jgi:hypothetical protein
MDLAPCCGSLDLENLGLEVPIISHPADAVVANATITRNSLPTLL